MKKLLLLVTVALLGSVSAWAQNALAPKLGETHTYSLKDISRAGAAVDVTYSTTFKIVADPTTNTGDSPELIAATGETSSIDDANTITVYDTDGTTATSTATWTRTGSTPALKVRWNGAANGNVFYIIATTTSSDNCANNVKAWRVEPVNSTFAITNLLLANNDGTTNSNNVCRSEVATLTYKNGTGFTYDYGTNYMYVKVTAENMSTGTGKGWKPVVTVVDNTKGKTSGELTKLTSGTYDYAVATAIDWSDNTKIFDKDTYTTATEIIVRIPLANGTNEGTAAQDIDVYIDGVDIDKGDDVATTTGSFQTTEDMVTETIKARPAVSANAPAFN